MDLRNNGKTPQKHDVDNGRINHWPCAGIVVRALAHGTGLDCGGPPKQGPIIVLFVLIFLFSGPGLAASGFSLPETTQARLQSLAGMTDPVLFPHAPERNILQQSDGSLVLFRIQEQNGNDYYLFLREYQEEFPLAAPGAYVIRRRQSDGAFTQVKIFLQHHEGSFVRIVPDGCRSRMDVFLAGVRIYQRVPLPVQFSRLLQLPFQAVERASEAMVDWSLFSVDPTNIGYRYIETVVQQIRSELPYLLDAEDGAMDAEGNPVFIEDLRFQENLPGFNCSGFAKWIVDGFYAPLSGHLLSISELKEKHLDLRGTQWSSSLEEERDPYFGLDWTRNLAVALNSAVGARESPIPNVENYDIREIPFAPYREDVGFPVQDLGAILYWLAKTEPGNFYLGSVNNSYGTWPVLRQHTHVVVVFPYFDLTGRFHAVVMERNVESSLADLERRYSRDFVHLVRITGQSPFIVPRFRSDQTN